MIVGGPFSLSELTAAFRYHGRHWDAAAKRRRVAARLAEVRKRTKSNAAEFVAERHARQSRTVESLRLLGLSP